MFLEGDIEGIMGTLFHKRKFKDMQGFMYMHLGMFSDTYNFSEQTSIFLKYEL